MLASINGTDITKYIQETSYQISQETREDEFYDGNHKLHLVPLRNYVKGSFEMAFVKSSDLTNFLNLVAANKTGNLLKITLWVSNLNQAAEKDVYFKMKSKKKIKINANYDLNIFNVEIEEA